jgi:hypothetical protein
MLWLLGKPWYFVLLLYTLNICAPKINQTISLLVKEVIICMIEKNGVANILGDFYPLQVFKRVEKLRKKGKLVPCWKISHDYSAKKTQVRTTSNTNPPTRGGSMYSPGVAVATPELLPGSGIFGDFLRFLAIFGHFLTISLPLKRIFATPKQIFVFRYPWQKLLVPPLPPTDNTITTIGECAGKTTKCSRHHYEKPMISDKTEDKSSKNNACSRKRN